MHKPEICTNDITRREMNRIDNLFSKKKGNILSIYFTAGHPTRNATKTIIETLEKSGVDMIEIGIPFSDPVADGPVIQNSSHVALQNGMSLKVLFEQLRDIRRNVSIPLLLMGYLNPVIQFGIEEFASECEQVGIDGTILPDLPLDIFQEQFRQVWETHKLYNVFLATPQTSNERFRLLDRESSGFLYMVAASATTGVRNRFEDYQHKYFERIKALDLKLPRMIGFGISSGETFRQACHYASGAIIGSAFVQALEKEGKLETNISDFVRSVLTT